MFSTTSIISSLLLLTSLVSATPTPANSRSLNFGTIPLPEIVDKITAPILDKVTLPIPLDLATAWTLYAVTNGIKLPVDALLSNLTTRAEPASNGQRMRRGMRPAAPARLFDNAKRALSPRASPTPGDANYQLIGCVSNAACNGGCQLNSFIPFVSLTQCEITCINRADGNDDVAVIQDASNNNIACGCVASYTGVVPCSLTSFVYYDRIL